MEQNPVGLDGMEFLEFASADDSKLDPLFKRLGLVKIGQHKTKKVYLYRQADINFIINCEPDSFASAFYKSHGPSICATGFRAKNAKAAFDAAVKRGAKPSDFEISINSFNF